MYTNTRTDRQIHNTNNFKKPYWLSPRVYSIVFFYVSGEETKKLENDFSIWRRIWSLFPSFASRYTELFSVRYKWRYGMNWIFQSDEKWAKVCCHDIITIFITSIKFIFCYGGEHLTVLPFRAFEVRKIVKTFRAIA